ncbi:hypothetical protein B0A55_04538 [Friedmanniomyces simplex]|uniref:Uncharacterized protein n=1 Tax=Friedmanniomyces simplex TaxID=329884 RepID=A0A4U0XQM9_9PEZI|nr:hypothetical protein B0A55_04538 [Friedmanniomyces simplex]
MLALLTFYEHHQSFVPNRSVSRLNPAVEPNWENVAEFLLMQPHIKILRAVVDNTLPRRARYELKYFIRKPLSTTIWPKDQPDPAVYINWLADKAGDDLTPDEYDQFLDALEAAGRVPRRQGNVYELTKNALQQEVDTALVKTTGRASNVDFWGKLTGKEPTTLP